MQNEIEFARRVRPRTVYLGRAPGRLDVMGGNADYTGGLVFEATIRRATWAAVALRDDQRLVFHNPQAASHGWSSDAVFNFAQLESENAVQALAGSGSMHWTVYVLGAFYLLRERFPEKVTAGADVYIRSEVPMNKGVSSSAALEVAVAKTAGHAYGITLQGVELAAFCQYLENSIAGSACGIMDQYTVAAGKEGYVLPLLCQPCTPLAPVRLPDDVACWGIDSGVAHQVSGVEHESARAAAFMGYRLICSWEGIPVRADPASLIPRWTDPRWNGYLANIPPSQFRALYEDRLPEVMTAEEYVSTAGAHVDPFTSARPGLPYKVKANTRYAVEENGRIRQFVALARGGTEYELMGELMYQSHHAYSECGLGSEATDELVELVRQAGAENGLYGARVSGGGGGGTVVVLGKKSAYPALQRLVIEPFALRRGDKPHIFSGSSPGADYFGVREFRSR